MPQDPFYWSPPWRALRARFLRAHPTCPCGEPASHVDHIRPRRQQPELALVWANLQALCASCHNSRTAVLQTPQNKGAKPASIGICNEAGTPLHPDHPWNTRR